MDNEKKIKTMSINKKYLFTCFVYMLMFVSTNIFYLHKWIVMKETIPMFRKKGTKKEKKKSKKKKWKKYWCVRFCEFKKSSSFKWLRVVERLKQNNSKI